MKISANSTASLNSIAGPELQQKTSQASSDKGVNFSDFLSQDIFESLKDIKNKVSTGKDVSTRELLQYQIQAQEIHFKVELVGKVAETALASAKRLQQG